MTGDTGNNPEMNEEKDENETQRETAVNEFSESEELEGKLAPNPEQEKLMRTVLENDKEEIPEGNLLNAAINSGTQSFTPDLLFEQLTQNYKNAKQIYGERFIRELTGYDDSYVERNIKLPEFKRQLKDQIGQGVKNLKDQGLIDKKGKITEEGLTIAAISMTIEELEKLNRKGIYGKRANKAKAAQGEVADVKNYKQHHPYKDLALKATIKRTIRRGHQNIRKEDLLIKEKESKERATIIYAIDASGSMKGEKIAAAKRAGVALAYEAIRKNDTVGCTLFGKEIITDVPPTKDFQKLITTIIPAQAAKETNIAEAINHATMHLNKTRNAKHLILLTDGLQTIGKDPTQTVLEAANNAKRQGITISVVGLQLDKEGEALSKRIVEVGKGTLYLVKDYKDLDLILLEDYYKTKR